jgi:hypothetical protein
MRADLREKFAQRERALVDTLTHELRLSSDVRVQHMSAGPGTAPKAARKAIRLLIRLQKSSLACDLYLKHRSAAMKRACRELRLTEDPLSYQKQLTRIVMGTLCDVAQEFSVLFADNAGCCSGW